MNTPPENQEIDLQIAEVISRWIETAQESRPTPSELIEQHPGLAPGLAECLQGLARVQHGKVGLARSVAEEDDFEEDEAAFPVIPDFEVLGELGRGGMGIVYEAKQQSLDRVVALKLLPFGAVDPRMVKRFLREAETVAALAHPGIVPIYATGVHEGLNWFAMQRIEGCPLSQWFAVATFDSQAAKLREVVRVGIEVAEALEHAHQRGVIHRDVKPGNLLVDTTGKVWLTDFGLARRDVDVTATVTGAVLGTPRYMSAEQVSHPSEAIDARTDIYSLGATLYEMATGQPPFTAESPLELLTQIRRDEPTPPRKINPSIPSTLQLVILKCLDKEPARRYQSAAALADDLKAIRDNRPISARGLPVWVSASRFLQRNKRQSGAMLKSVVGTAAVVVVVIFGWQDNEKVTLGRVHINTPAGSYVANIQPRYENIYGQVSEVVSSSLTTTPMQQPISLKAGDYEVRLEGAGKPSQTLDLLVKPRRSIQIEYIDRRDSLLELDIHKKLSVPMSGGALAVLSQDTFEVFDPPDSSKSLPLPHGAAPLNSRAGAKGDENAEEIARNVRRFSLPIKQLDEGFVEEVPSMKDPDARVKVHLVKFGFNADQSFQGDYSVARSGFARIERIGTSQVDLNGDGQNDFLLTAARHAAITAVSSDGKVLWQRRLPIGFEIKEVFPKESASTINEAIVGITPIDDLDKDGVPDLVINAAFFDSKGNIRPYIFTLSGHDGHQIAIAPFREIVMQNKKAWPWSGRLRKQRGSDSDHRAPPLANSHSDILAKRTQEIDSQSRRNSENSVVYVLPPLVLGKHNDNWVACTATERALHFVNLADGTVAVPDISLLQPILRGPQRVRLAEGKLGVLVLKGNASKFRSKCVLELYVPGESQPRWSISENLDTNSLVEGAADCSLPLVIDLDGDGDDEVLSQTSPESSFGRPQLQCYSSSGKLRWAAQGLVGISPVINKALPVGDVNGDGIIDLATVGLLTSYSASSMSARRPKNDIRLKVDFLSGKDGRRLGYREEYVAASVKGNEIAEIDYVQLWGHELVCSVAYGSPEELKLSTMSITFDLTQLRPATVARGLTALGMGDQHIDATRGRWYRRRSGPYASPGDAAVWVARELKQSSYPNESLLASWISRSKAPRVLLGGSFGDVRCLDPLDGRTLWTGRRSFLDNNPARVLELPDGSIDLAYMTPFNDSALGFHDGDTGRLRFKIKSPMVDTAFLSLCSDMQAPHRFVYALAAADTSRTSVFPRERDPGFLLLKIDRLAGQVVWWKRYYEDKFPTNPKRPADPIQFDVNGDQVTDLITGNTKNGRLVVQAIDGRDGQTLWEYPLQLVANYRHVRSHRPIMTLIPSGRQNYLLLIDGVKDDSNLYALKSLRIRDGDVLHDIRGSLSTSVLDASEYRRLSLNVTSPHKRDGMVGLVTEFHEDDTAVDPSKRQRGDGQLYWSLLQVDEQTGVMKKVGRSEASHSAALPSERDKLDTFFLHFAADVDGDQARERIEIYDRNQVKIRRAAGDEPISEFEIEGGSSLIRLEQLADKCYLASGSRNGEHLWYELPTGRLAFRFGQGLNYEEKGETASPNLLAHGRGTLLFGSTPEAALCAQLQASTKSSSLKQPGSFSVAMVSADVDPIYRREIYAHGLFAHRGLLDLIGLAVLTFGAIFLPMGFVFRLVRHRQWSLRIMLLVPAVVMSALVCWRALLSWPSRGLISDISIVGVTLMSAWSLFTLIRYRNWRMLRVWIPLSMVVATLMMFGAQVTFPLRNPGMIGYWTVSAWITAVLAAAAHMVIPMAVVATWSRLNAKKVSSNP